MIKQIGKNLPKADEEIDLQGRLVIPPYVDAHLHLDYVYTGKNDGAMNSSGTLFEGIARWHDVKKTQTFEAAKERALKGINEEVSKGVQFIRTHIDVDDPKLTGLKAMLEIREQLKDSITIQIVAFPQEGMYAYKGGEEMVEEALKMGADCVGAIPHFEWAREIGEKSIHRTVELAVKYNKLIDVHCDETDDVMSRFVELLNALVMSEGIGSRTAASHTCSFGSADNAYAFRMMRLFQKSGLNFISLPTENAYLQGRQDTYPKRRGLTRVKELWESGINVCFGQDSINDPWYPVGNGNMMNILDNGIHLAQTMSFDELDRCLNLITSNGAKTLNVEDQYGIEVGKPANFIVLNAKSPFEAVRQRADVLASIRNGEYLFKRPEPRYEVEFDAFEKIS
ncbi:N-isopropylammelide isopropylaminohydrolase [Nitrosomonas eutropha C91]|uniref:N-isopropylammelide isopropylaminohydrolase n=1 Tax=Nitrosomonas eutropha (strain DSM 101675 / C91 / Nm57) TaxID=335283 RepID=Q0AFC1_NITEC|nr:N-isopropylammelide isopropylaminohydrolase [Nitrosomonas eutropha C91]